MLMIASLVLLHAPVLIPPGTERKIATLLKYCILWSFIFYSLIAPFIMRRRYSMKLPRSRQYFALFCAFWFLVSVSYMRAFVYGVVEPKPLSMFYLDWLTVVMFAFAVFHGRRSEVETARSNKAIVLCLFLFITANAVLFLMGVENTVWLKVNEGLVPSRLAELAGLHLNRQQVPLAAGLNNVGMLSGATILLGVLLIIVMRRNAMLKVLAGASIASALLCIMLTDSRASMMLIAPVLIMFVAVPKKYYRVITFLPALIPLFIPIVLSILVMLPHGMISALSRNDNAVDVYTVSSRTLIWMSSIEVLQPFVATHLIGYGAFGQVTSGASHGYTQMFSEWNSEAGHRFSAHNFALQTVLDHGYIGLLFMLYFFYRTARLFLERWKESGDSVYILFMAYLSYIFLTGVGETAGTVYQSDLFILLTYMIVSAMTANRLQRSRVRFAARYDDR